MTLAVRVKIKGSNWVVYFLPTKEFKKKYGTDYVGMAECEDQEIYILANQGLKAERLLHELWHAYISETCVDVADLSGDQMEEVSSEIFAKHGRHMIHQAEMVMKRYYHLRAKAKR